MAGGDDSRQTSMGVHGRTGPRNAPTVWNAAFHSVQFWDGRAKTLEDQAKGPVVANVEMGMGDLDTALAHMRDIPGYVQQFKSVFGGELPVTIDNAAKAVAHARSQRGRPGTSKEPLKRRPCITTILRRREVKNTG